MIRFVLLNLVLFLLAGAPLFAGESWWLTVGGTINGFIQEGDIHPSGGPEVSLFHATGDGRGNVVFSGIYGDCMFGGGYRARVTIGPEFGKNYTPMWDYRTVGWGMDGGYLWTREDDDSTHNGIALRLFFFPGLPVMVFARYGLVFDRPDYVEIGVIGKWPVALSSTQPGADSR